MMLFGLFHEIYDRSPKRYPFPLDRRLTSKESAALTVYQCSGYGCGAVECWNTWEQMSDLIDQQRYWQIPLNVRLDLTILEAKAVGSGGCAANSRVALHETQEFNSAIIAWFKKRARQAAKH